MNPLGLNFVERRRYVSPLGWLLLAGGAALAVVLAFDLRDAQTELERVQLQQARLSRPVATARAKSASKPAAREDVKLIERVASKLQLPWDAVLDEIDQLEDPAVAILGVEAQGQAHSLRLTGEAREMADVVAYVRRLRKSPSIESANLSHHEEKQAGAVKVIRFSLDANWRAPS
jgi:Tfp pilus assembly protein PilN